MRLFRLIKKPIVTEESTRQEMRNNTYIFEVDNAATKIDIKKAISEIYGVMPVSVNTLNTRAKQKYGKKRILNQKRAATKKAFVTLAEGDKIDVTQVK